MARPGPTTPDIEDVRVYLKGVAKFLVHQLYGGKGPPWGTSLAALEDLLDSVHQQLAAEFFSLALQLQADHHADAPAEFHSCPSCQQPLLCSEDPQPRAIRTTVGLALWNEPHAYCRRCRRSFFPQSRSLGIDQSELSASVARKVVSFGVRSRSFAEASESLHDGPGLEVSPKQVERLVHQVGQERIDERDALVEHFQNLPLVEKFAVPKGVTAPELAVVLVDGGRLQLRTDFHQPHPPTEDPTRPAEQEEPLAADGHDKDFDDSAEDAAERRKKHWREDKVGLLMTMHSQPCDSDPCPEIPPSFLELERVSKLARQIHQQARAGQEAASVAVEPEAEACALEENSTYVAPEVTRKRVLASRLRWPLFALVVAATAWSLGFQGSRRKAFVGDGADNNWALHRRFFGSFVPILDFIHVLSYVFAAAQAGRTAEAGHEVYRRWIRWVWKGEVRKVIKELARRGKELAKEEGDKQAREVVMGTLKYLLHHRGKMKYAEYRQEGLPITSSLVESTVKQINHRVKGTEKFWTEEGAEAILQLRADQLSEEELDGFWERRQTNASGQRRYRCTKRPSRKPKPSVPVTLGPGSSTN